jgi:hypothetical protein
MRQHPDCQRGTPEAAKGRNQVVRVFAEISNGTDGAQMQRSTEAEWQHRKIKTPTGFGIHPASGGSVVTVGGVIRRRFSGVQNVNNQRKYRMSQNPNKYLRRIYAGGAINKHIMIDVYQVLEAFDVRCPAKQHAIKKLLCAGMRGSKDAVQDLREAGAAIDRAIDMERQRIEDRGHAQ